MNLTNFSLSISKTQYDVYKYKLDSCISYNKRKVYRYKVGDLVYDLRTEKLFKYLMKVEVDKKNWSTFRNDDSWEYLVTTYNLLDVIVEHISGILKINSFCKVILPEDLEDLISFDEDPSSKTKLNISWFNNYIEVPRDTLNLSIFSN